MSTLTIYLLREEFKSPGDAIDGAPYELPVSSSTEAFGTLYLKQKPAKRPKWAGLFEGYADLSKIALVSTSSGVFVIEAGGRLFALAFGTGRFLLRAGAFEDRFGLLVVINSVASDHLRSIDKRTFDAVDQNVRSQVSQQSSAAEFGIDIEKDLIRAITGAPIDASVGTRMTGADALSVSVSASLPQLRDLLIKYLSAFLSSAYKKDFSWIDHINQIGDKSPLKDELDSELIKLLEVSRATGGHAKDCWIAIPDVIDYSGVHRFRFTGNRGSFSDLHLPAFIESLKADDQISVEFLKRRTAYAVDEDGNPVGDKWPVYKCIHCEVEQSGSSYLLSGGHWFRIKNDFAAEVDAFYASIKCVNLNWKEYAHESEGKYNSDVCSSDSTLTLFDAKLISVGGIYDKVEFCDVLRGSDTLIHVKRYGGSGLLGHLFNQGLVSGEHLREDKEFLQKVNALLPPAKKLQDPKVPRDVSKYKIIFAIISEDAAPNLHIPFFARVTLKHVYRRLASMGYTEIQLAKIAVNDKFKKAERLKAKSVAKKSGTNAAITSVN